MAMPAFLNGAYLPYNPLLFVAKKLACAIFTTMNDNGFNETIGIVRALRAEVRAA
jgi:hypothetical protein